MKHYNNGDKYIGYYKNNVKTGDGLFYYNNGDLYKGNYKNDLKNGKGIYYYNI